MSEGARVCVIDSDRLGPAYARLERCRLEVTAVLPRFVELAGDAIERFDVILIGCDERAMLAARFEESVRRMAALRPVVAIVSRPTERVALHAARAGFHGLVARDVAPKALARTIAAVLRGELAFSRSTLSALARSAAANGNSRAGVQLTARQRQVVDLVAQGKTDDQIARTLGISSSTAHKHVMNALRRANARTRGQLIAAVVLPWVVPVARGAS